MSRTRQKAKNVIDSLRSGKSVSEIKQEMCNNDDCSWNRISSVAFSIVLDEERKKRDQASQISKRAYTSTSTIQKILDLNDILSSYALCIPDSCTISEIENISEIVHANEVDEIILLRAIAWRTMNPRLRVRMMRGRILHFAPFVPFSKIINAAELSYYRGNYVSSFLTLVPVIEGIILRWMGYNGNVEKPKFDVIKKFFNRSFIRQPVPGNPLFYDVFCRVCDKILNNHLFKHSGGGDAYANFNRHLAAHLINGNTFGSEENCIRLFVLLDLMTEIYLYETRCKDPMFYLDDDDVKNEIEIFEYLRHMDQFHCTPENELINGSSAPIPPYKFKNKFLTTLLELMLFKDRRN